MHEVGEKVVYGSNGIMEIVDIKEEVVDGSTKKYYVLCEYASSSDSQTYVPLENKKLVKSMRRLLTVDEARALISRAGDVLPIEWQEDNRIRSEKFRKIIDSGDRDKIVAMIKAIYQNGERRRLSGKKNYLADESVVKRAEKMLTSELSAVLDIGEDEALSLLQSSCGKK